MKPGDLVVGISHEYMGMTITPVGGAVGVVIDLDPSSQSARVLYNNWIYTYFQSELRVLSETDGDDQDSLLQGGQAGVAPSLHPLVDPEPVQPR